VRILTGNRSLTFWEDMIKVSEMAIEQINHNKDSGKYKGN